MPNYYAGNVDRKHSPVSSHKIKSLRFNNKGISRHWTISWARWVQVTPSHPV